MDASWSIRDCIFQGSPLYGLVCIVAFVLSGPSILGCSKTESSSKSVKPVFCYSSMERKSPGKLHLANPIGCSAQKKRYRAQGRRDMPDVVDLIDEKGSVLITYRMDYDSMARVIKETRIFKEKPRGLNVYELGNIYRFSSPDNGKWQQVEIITDLDEQGRTTKVTKKVAGRVEYVMKRQYTPRGLLRETVLEPDGTVRVQSEYRSDGDKIVETMRDAKGKVIMRRTLPDKNQDSASSSNVESRDNGSPVVKE